MNKQLAIWFPAVRTNTGTDVFTERLINALNESGIKAEATWLPLRAEYAPWSVPIPQPPSWATVAHISTWLHPRFIPKGLPVVATIHHAVHHPSALSYKGWLRAAYHKYWIAPIERRVMYRADKVVAVSQFAADTAKQTLANLPMQVIYNGIDTDIFTPDHRKQKLNKPFRLLYVGSWMARKGVDLLTPIMRELGDDFELFYTGGPAARKEKTSMPSNMQDSGRLNGDQEVAKAMQNADALIFPSRSEGFGLVAVEAMACGLPVIGTRAAPLTEIIDHGITGILCDSDDINAFTTSIRTLKNSKNTYKNMREASHNRARDFFSLVKMINEHVKMYKEVSQMPGSNTHAAETDKHLTR